jgi:hypothetical protein
MQEGDRVMVYDSPGHPLDHYLYAHVLTLNAAGALVLVDHPGNASNGQQKFVKAEKIITGAIAEKLQADAREALKTERDSEKIKTLREQVQHFGVVAQELS